MTFPLAPALAASAKAHVVYGPARATARLVANADAAYDREDRDWFYNLSTAHLVTLWGLVSGENFLTPAGPWDDEVYDALAAHGWFDTATEN